eukprot:1143642-Pelagomonas_calceolata.AAC.2
MVPTTKYQHSNVWGMQQSKTTSGHTRPGVCAFMATVRTWTSSSFGRPNQKVWDRACNTCKVQSHEQNLALGPGPSALQAPCSGPGSRTQRGGVPVIRAG